MYHDRRAAISLAVAEARGKDTIAVNLATKRNRYGA
jgi:hypothetical protein